MKLAIYGPNLIDQTKGQFVVHAAGCADCKKLDRQVSPDSPKHLEEHADALSVSRSIYADMIDEGSMAAEDGLADIWFAPCVHFEQ